MKKGLFYINMIVLALFVVTLGQSCTDLEEELFDTIPEDQFFTSEAELEAGFAEAYSRLSGIAGHNNVFSAQTVSSDEAMIPQRGGDWFDGGVWLRVHRHEYTATEEVVSNVWNWGYSAVNMCNLLIETFELNEVEQELVSEVKVLRAYYMWTLMDVFGNVPIVDRTGLTFPANNTRAEVYDFVISELEANVPNLSELVDKRYARFHKYAGHALMARIYLNAEVYSGKAEWAKAEAAADAAIAGPFMMEDDYFANFNTDNDASTEIIMGIPYDRANLVGFNIAQMTLHYGSQATFELQDQPWNGYCALQEFYNSYEDGDRRKGVYGNQSVRGNFHAGPQYTADGVTPITDSGVESTDPDGENLVFTPEINEHFPNALRQAGARIGKFEFAKGASPNLSTDYPLFRLGGVMLDKAEAIWRQTPGSTDALNMVNNIRMRADVDPFGSLTAENLLAERGREGFAEMWRRQDLIRFGQWGAEWDFKPASDATKEIYPIPQPQLNINENLRQNDGY